MATCRECNHCQIHVGYWICRGGEKKVMKLDDLEQDGMEECSYFDSKMLTSIPNA